MVTEAGQETDASPILAVPATKKGRDSSVPSDAKLPQEEAALLRTGIVLPAVVASLWLSLAGYFVLHLGGTGLDDFFITYRYAENLASGNGFVFNPGERVFGTTAPGMGLLLASLRSITTIPVPWWGTISTGLSLLVLAVVLLREASRGDWLPEAVLGGTLALGSTLLWGCRGAEVFVVLALLAVAAMIGERAPVWCGALAGLAVWMRPDSLLAVVVLGAVLSIERKRLPWRYGLAAAAVVLLGLALAWAYFGSVLPNTLLAKRLRPPVESQWLAWWEPAVQIVRRHLGPHFEVLVTLGLLGSVLMVLRAGRVGRVIALYGLSSALIYPFLGVVFATWYAVPLIVAATYGCAFSLCFGGRLVVRAWPGAWGRPTAIVGTSLLLFLLLPSMVASERKWLRGAKFQPHYEGYREAGEWIRGHSEPTDAISFVEVGTLAYFSDRPVEDLLGLVSPRSVPYVAEDDLLGAFLAKPTKFVINRPGLDGFMGPITTTSWFQSGYREVARFHPESVDWTVVYERDKAAAIPPPRPPRRRGSAQ